MTERVITGHRARVLRRALTAAVWTGSDRIDRLIVRAVPAVHRERDRHDGTWIIFGSRVDSAIAAMQRAGVAVEIVAERLGGGGS